MQKHEREVVNALKKLGCTDITFERQQVHRVVSFRLPSGVTRVTTLSTSPKNADNVVKETCRLVRHMIKETTQ